MLLLDNINIQFGDKVIFDHACYKAYKGKINLIEGKSGSGKSTLIQALLFKYPCLYSFNNLYLSSLDEEEQADFIFRKMSVVYQEPLFIDDLTVRQNASFLHRLYGTHDEMEKIQEYLDIRDLLDKYPGQLSGGEKTRVSIWLALLKIPEVLILDEPTASLDEVNKTKVIKALQAYAKHAVVICSTHDTSFLNAECNKAAVKDKKIITEEYNENQTTPVPKEKKNAVPDQLYVFVKSFRHHPLKNFGKMFFLCLSTVFMFLSFNFNNAVMDSLNESLNDLSSREMIIYKPLFADFHYIHDSETFPFTDEELEAVRNIEGIETLTPRIDLFVDGNYLYESYDSFFNNEYKESLGDRYFEDSSRRKTEFLDASGAVIQTAEHAYAVEVYADGRNYSDAIIKSFQEEGVFISDRMISNFGLQLDNRPSLTFILPVPLYNSFGNIYIPPPDSGNEINELYPRNSTVCMPLKITLPIKATIRNSHADLMIPESVYLEQIEAYRPEAQELTVYFIRENGEYYINELPEEYADIVFENTAVGNVKVDLELWKPAAWTATCADLGEMYDVIERIEEAGFKADNDYYDTQTVITVQESTRLTMIVISVFISVIIFAAYFIIQYIRRGEIIRFNEYMRINGINEKGRTSFCIKDTGMRTVLEILLAGFLYMFLISLLARLGIAVIRPDFKAFAGMAAAVFIAEFIFPNLLRRGMLNDKLQKY